MISRIARRISVLFSKTLAYNNTFNLITCMHQERIPNSVDIPMGNTGEAIQIEYKKRNTSKFAYLMSRCWGNIDSLKKKTHRSLPLLLLQKTLILIELLHQVGGRISWACSWWGVMWEARKWMQVSGKVQNYADGVILSLWREGDSPAPAGWMTWAFSWFPLHELFLHCYHPLRFCFQVNL